MQKVIKFDSGIMEVESTCKCGEKDTFSFDTTRQGEILSVHDRSLIGAALAWIDGNCHVTTLESAIKNHPKYKRRKR